MTNEYFQWFVIKALKLLIAYALGANRDQLQRRGMAWIRMADAHMDQNESELDITYEVEVSRN